MVVAAVGPPNVYLSHAWATSFQDSIHAAVGWCALQQVDPASVYIWMDAFCLDQVWDVASSLACQNR